MKVLTPMSPEAAWATFASDYDSLRTSPQRLETDVDGRRVVLAHTDNDGSTQIFAFGFKVGKSPWIFFDIRAYVDAHEWLDKNLTFGEETLREVDRVLNTVPGVITKLTDIANRQRESARG